MADNLAVSGTSDPYASTRYTPGSNDKNTLTMESYFKLLAAQLQYQDMNKPMDNSEMMAQMTQMAQVQSMSAMTESIQTSSAINTSTYASGLMGQEITVAKTEKGPNGVPYPVGVIYGTVESVNLATSPPTMKLQGDDTDYPLSYVLGMGKIDDPYVEEDEDVEGEGGEGGDGGTGDDGDTGGDGGTGGDTTRAVGGIW